MEIVAIEKRTFEQMMQRFEDFIKQINALCGQNRSTDNCLDNKQVCELLKISLRTLQTYRDTGVLPYSQKELNTTKKPLTYIYNCFLSLTKCGFLEIHHFPIHLLHESV